MAFKPLASLDALGGQLAFHLGVLKAIPRSVTRYPREILRILAEVTLGTGALAVIGGTVGVIIGMTFFTGAQVGLSGYAALNQLGTAAFSGFVSAYFNTREIAPLVAGIALAATVGCGFTAQLGAMRISEEVDALEVMAIPSMPFLVATRVVGGLIAIIPLYVVGLLSSYFASRLVVTQFYGQSAGHLRPLLQRVPAAGRRAVVLRQGPGLRRHRDPHPLLPRLQRLRRSRRRGRGRGPRRALEHRGDQRHRPAAVHGHLGRLDHRAAGGVRRTMKLKALGVVFLALMLASVWATYGVFTKKFTDYDEVTVKASKIGLQLPQRADVKIRGVIVGEVLDYRADRRRRRHHPGPLPGPHHRTSRRTSPPRSCPRRSSARSSCRSSSPQGGSSGPADRGPAT